MLKNFFLMIIAFIIVVIFGPIVFVLNCILRKDKKKYFFAVAIGLDQLGGSILYSRPDWTVSSWTYYLAEYRNRKPAKIFMKFIDSIFGKNHCKNSFNWEKKYQIIQEK